MSRSRKEMCEAALLDVEAYRERFPDDPALTSVAEQLRYLIKIERQDQADTSRLGELTLGRLATHELGSIIDDDLSKLLCEIAQGVRRQIDK